MRMISHRRRHVSIRIYLGILIATAREATPTFLPLFFHTDELVLGLRQSTSVEKNSPRPMQHDNNRNRACLCLWMDTHGNDIATLVGEFENHPVNNDTLLEPYVPSTFWYSTSNIRIEPPENVIPFQPSLDSHEGPLPYGSYRNYDHPMDTVMGRTFKKPYCIVSLSLDIPDKKNIDCDKAVSHMQQCMDAGFTSFSIPKSIVKSSADRHVTNHLSPTSSQVFLESQLYNNLIRSTPPFLLDSMSIATRIRVPLKDYSNSSPQGPVHKFVRSEIMASLQRMYKGTTKNKMGCGNPALDVVQVEYSKDNSPYHVDVVHTLMELQREGWVRSIVGSGMPNSMIQRIEQECSIHLDGNQVQGNLIDPNEYLKQLRIKSSSGEYLLGKNDPDARRFIHLTSPLACGILSNTFLDWPHHKRNYRGIPQWHGTNPSVLWHYRNSILRTWRKSVSNEKEQLYLRTKKTGVNPTNRGGALLSTWQKFENIVLMTLQRIAHKHEVSISSVALRWALQSGELASIFLGTSLNAKEGDDRPFVRPAELRNIMKFMLDDEDMKELWAVSGKEEEIDPNQDPEEYHEFSNRKLWL